MKIIKKAILALLIIGIIIAIGSVIYYYPWKQKAEKKLPSSATEIRSYQKIGGLDGWFYLLKAKLPEKDFYQYQKTMEFKSMSAETKQKYHVFSGFWQPTVSWGELPSWWNPSRSVDDMYYDPNCIEVDMFHVMKYENGYLYYQETEW